MKILFFDVGSCSIFTPYEVELTILLEENVFHEAPLATSIALVMEWYLKGFCY